MAEEDRAGPFDPEEEDGFLEKPEHYINREISWLRFNERVLEEARDNHPLLERVKFLAICAGNLDEFFMIRVSGLRKQLQKGVLEAPPDGMTPYEQLTESRKIVAELYTEYSKCWMNELLPELEKNGIGIKKISDLDREKRTAMKKYFEQMIFPVLTPQAFDVTHPFPTISNLTLNLAVVVKDQKGEKFARVKVPTKLFPRLIPVPDGDAGGKNNTYVFLEDLIADNIELLFPGMRIAGVYPFRITRNADIEIALDEASDLMTTIEECMDARRVGYPVRLELDKDTPAHIRTLFVHRLGLEEDMVYPIEGPMGLADLWQLLSLTRPELKDAPFLPHTPRMLEDNKNMFSSIAQRDYVLYHPYDSFNIMINLLKKAARDPDVLAIKITLYRIDPKSPVIDALIEARQNGKTVTALVELKAKFDEQNNINWARALEHAGVHVVYGLVDLKVHAKICLIVRREAGKIVRYSHIGSGNYNAVTSRIYGDIGYLTANHEIGAELSHLLNSLTGYSAKEDYGNLLVAPKKMKTEIIARIEREVASHQKTKDGYIAFKLNGLVDRDIIKALYRASRAGVRIDLNVRGLCCLRPGVKELSENIKVISIVGRFLEHARIYFFRNAGKEEVLLGSSDMMPRNLKRRIEVLVPVPDPRLRKAIVEKMLYVHLRDNVKGRRLLSHGRYERLAPKEGEEKMNSQEWLIANKGFWHEER